MTRILDRVPPRWRDRLDSWQWWVGVAYFAIVVVVVFEVYLNNRTAHLAAANAKTLAIRQADANSAVSQCIASIPLLERTSEHVRGVNDLVATLIANSRASIRAAPKHDPLAAARRANLARLLMVQREVGAIRFFPTPTPAQCRSRSSSR